MSSSGDQQRLEFFPVSIFSMVMGLAGLTIAWHKARLVLGIGPDLHAGLVGLTTLVFTTLALLYLRKLVKYPKAVMMELRHPVKLSFFPTISINLVLLSICFLPLAADISRWLWLVGASLHLLFTLYVVNVWFHHDHFEVQHLNPAWFIPAVGNVLVPIAGVPLGYMDVSWFFFSIGMLFWVMLMTVIFYRVLFHHPIDEKLMPTLFILIAPPAVGFVAYLGLAGGLDNFARFLYYSGLFLTLLLITQAAKFVKLPFALSWWAYSFPLAAITIASLLMLEQTGTSMYGWIGAGLLIFSTLVVSLLLVRTIRAVIARKVCLPGN